MITIEDFEKILNDSKGIGCRAKRTISMHFDPDTRRHRKLEDIIIRIPNRESALQVYGYTSCGKFNDIYILLEKLGIPIE